MNFRGILIPNCIFENKTTEVTTLQIIWLAHMPTEFFVIPLCLKEQGENL